MDAEFEYGPTRFSEWAMLEPEWSSQSLQSLSGEIIEDFRTSLTERVSRAWAQPLDLLTCEQVRLLVSQKMGLHWLAKAVCRFVACNPMAFVSLYDGDLSIAALRAFSILMTLAEDDARAIAQLDLSKMVDHWRDIDPRFASEIAALGAEARTVAGPRH